MMPISTTKTAFGYADSLRRSMLTAVYGVGGMIFIGRSGWVSFARTFCLILSIATIPLLPMAATAAVGGSISGTVKDATGGVIPGANVTVTNVALRTEFKTMTDGRGYFSFPTLAVGRYDLTIEMDGLKPRRRVGLLLDIDTALDVNATLEISQISQEVSVSTDVAAEAVQVDTVSTQLGEVVTGKEMTTVEC